MVKIQNKKAWLRIVEATISIVLILGAILIFYQISSAKSSDDFGQILPSLTDQIAKNESIRSLISDLDASSPADVQSAHVEIDDFIAEQIKRSDLNYSYVICNINDSCSVENLSASVSGNVVSYERIISSDLNSPTYNPLTTPKKFRIYLWKMS